MLQGVPLFSNKEKKHLQFFHIKYQIQLYKEAFDIVRRKARFFKNYVSERVDYL